MEKSEVAASRPEESPTIITDKIIPDFFHNDLAPRASPIESKHSFMTRGISAIFFQQHTELVHNFEAFFCMCMYISHHFSFSSTQNYIFFGGLECRVADPDPCQFMF
jgi:hypothetical protein